MTPAATNGHLLGRALRPRRAVVTGGDGYLGRHLVRALTEVGAKVLVVDDTRIGRAPAVPLPGVELARHDFRSSHAHAAIGEFEPDTLFHLAAMHFVPQCDADPTGCLELNVLGTERLLAAIRSTTVESVVFCSSAVVYGFSEVPRREDDELTPQHIYAHSKWLGEGLLRALHEDRPDVRTVSARMFNLVGPGDTARHLVPVVIDAVIEGRTLKLGNTWPTRDYIHVADVASALLALADGPPVSEAFNVGTGTGRSVADILDTVGEILGRPVAIEIDPSRERATDGHLVADISRLTDATGWAPRWTFEDTIRQLLEAAGAR